MEVVIMFTMKKKIVSGSLVALMALGLAGCVNNDAAPASKVSSHPQTTKVTQPSNKKASSTSKVATAKSNSQANAASATTKASYAAQTNSSDQQNERVVNQFIKASGVKDNSASQYMVSQTSNKGSYQVEVRDSQGDPNVSHLDGLYRFNPATNQVQQMNPVTGQFENK